MIKKEREGENHKLRKFLFRWLFTILYFKTYKGRFFGTQGYLQGNADPVAVKQLFIKNQQSITEFLNEVVVVTAIKHRNLVNLKGCCVREDQRLLVYEYLENNDLARHLFSKRTTYMLSSMYSLVIIISTDYPITIISAW